MKIIPDDPQSNIDRQNNGCVQESADVSFRTDDTPHTSTASGVSVDLDEARRCLYAIDCTTEQHCFQTFDDKGADRSLARTLHGTLPELAETLTRLNQQGAGIFFTPNEIIPGAPRKAENVRRVRMVFVDNDKPELTAEVERRIALFGLPPSIIVESSPGKRHYYWRADDWPIDAFKSAQKRLIQLFDTDPSVHDLPRVMRLPGFFHQKGQPFRTRLVCVR